MKQSTGERHNLILVSTIFCEVQMANVPEAGMKIDGTVLRVAIDHDDKGNAYGTVQVSNDDGISDVSFNADSTRTMQVANIAPGTPIAWIVRPFVVFGTSKRSGNAYGFLKLNFLRDQLSALGASLND
ncbi:hypothetical protein [Bifidobacterium adolescentis]|uniref:hypothetical protein n=2 Tax=Bifidobacterium adolescentis TaxID=1680 RepID=UPI0012D7D83B|nr:hypothetical protein [Bifidobacterium adolescentis]